MAMVREGHVPVLMVVDVQVGVMQNAWEAARVIDKVAAAVARARARQVPVVWVQHTDADLALGSPPWQWAAGLGPVDAEAHFLKSFNSAFEGTALADHLAGLGATHLVLAGAATNWCIRATAYAALERGYDLTLLADAHTTESMTLEDGLTLHAEHLVRELNLALTWLSYPGRRNGTALAAEIEFEGAPQRAGG